jgi:hypothetical protein
VGEGPRKVPPIGGEDPYALDLYETGEFFLHGFHRDERSRVPGDSKRLSVAWSGALASDRESKGRGWEMELDTRFFEVVAQVIPVLLLAVLIETRHWVDRMGRLVNRVQGAPLLILFVVTLASLMIFFVPLMAEGIAVSTVDGEWWLPADVRLAVCYLALGGCSSF